MRSFQFSLERVLSWRRTELRSEEARLAPLVAERGRLEAAYADIVRAHAHAQEDLLASGPVNGAELEALAHYRIHLEKQKIAVAQKAQQCREGIGAQQVRIVEAQRRARLLEKLRERRLEEWRNIADREMENFAGEAFLARWRLRRRAGGAAIAG
jgi:flagellar export protein FliJ